MLVRDSARVAICRSLLRWCKRAQAFMKLCVRVPVLLGVERTIINASFNAVFRERSLGFSRLEFQSGETKTYIHIANVPGQCSLCLNCLLARGVN
jgi:hypothetical protein